MNRYQVNVGEMAELLDINFFEFTINLYFKRIMYFGRRLVIGFLFTYMKNIISLCDYVIFCDKYFAVFIHYSISSMANRSIFKMHGIKTM